MSVHQFQRVTMWLERTLRVQTCQSSIPTLQKMMDTTD